MKIVSKRHKEYRPKFDRIILPMIHRVVPSTIASELVQVQPMSEPSGLIFTTARFDWSLAEKMAKQKTVLKSKRHPDRIAAEETVEEKLNAALNCDFISRGYALGLAGFSAKDVEEALAGIDEDIDTLNPRGTKGDPGPIGMEGSFEDLRVLNDDYRSVIQCNSSTTIPFQHL